MDVNEICTRQGEMESARSNFDEMWRKVSEVVFPRSDDFDAKHAAGEQRNHKQYDAFPMLALNRFAAATEAGLIPRSSYWHKLKTGEDEIDEDHAVQEYYEELNAKLWRARYSPRSWFAPNAHEVLLSHGAYGNGCLYTEARQGGGIRYRAIHLGETFVACNLDGIADTVHRKYMLTVKNAAKLFGKDRLPEKMAQKFEAGKLDEKFEFIHCVMPNEAFEPGMLGELPFVSKHIALDAKDVLREEGYHEQPYHFSRYAVSTREDYGRGPATMFLPDILMLQEMKRTTIEVANMQADKPTLLHEDISEFDLTPGSQNYGTLDDNGNPLARPYDMDSEPAIGMDLMQDTRNQIDDGFMGVYFRVLLENPNMTATQAMLIAQQQGQMTAPVIGRLQSEWLDPMIRRESAILMRQGQHPEMPAKLRDYIEQTREPLSIEYETPLTLAARSGDVQAILRAFEAMAPFAQVDPKIYSTFKPMEVGEIIAEGVGVPAKARKSTEEREAEEAAAVQQEQLAALIDAAPQAASAAKDAAIAAKTLESNPQGVPA